MDTFQKYHATQLLAFHWPELSHVTTLINKGGWEILSSFLPMVMGSAKTSEDHILRNIEGN